MPGTYPSLTTIRPSYYNEDDPDYPVGSTEYQDFGADFKTYADTPVRRFTILYASEGGITESEALQFRTLAASNKYNREQGSALGFDFAPRGESTIGNVHFDKGGLVIRRGAKAHIWIVEVKLIKRP